MSGAYVDDDEGDDEDATRMMSRSLMGESDAQAETPEDLDDLEEADGDATVPISRGHLFAKLRPAAGAPAGLATRTPTRAAGPTAVSARAAGGHERAPTSSVTVPRGELPRRGAEESIDTGDTGELTVPHQRLPAAAQAAQGGPTPGGAAPQRQAQAQAPQTYALPPPAYRAPPLQAGAAPLRRAPPQHGASRDSAPPQPPHYPVSRDSAPPPQAHYAPQRGSAPPPAPPQPPQPPHYAPQRGSIPPPAPPQPPHYAPQRGSIPPPAPQPHYPTGRDSAPPQPPHYPPQRGSVPPPAPPPPPYASGAPAALRPPQPAPVPAVAPPPPSAHPASLRAQKVRSPPIFMAVMIACTVLTLTGLALLAYLKMRHFW